MWFPEKPSLEKSSIAGSQTKDLRSVDLFATDCTTPHPPSINVPDISNLLYLIFTGMYTFKASSKEPQNCACLCICMHHWLDSHVCLSGQRPKPGSIKDHVPNMLCLKQLGAICPYINNSNKSLPTEKCILNPFWKAVNLQYTRRPRLPC